MPMAMQLKIIIIKFICSSHTGYIPTNNTIVCFVQFVMIEKGEISLFPTGITPPHHQNMHSFALPLSRRELTGESF